MVFRLILGLSGGLLGGLLGGLACVAIDPNANLCAVGQAECSCTIGGACDPGLSCVDDVCVDPDATTTADEDTDTVDDTDVDATDDDTSTMTDPTDPSSDPTTEPGTSDTGPQPGMPNYAFVTSQAFSAGDIGGLMGADMKCQDAANAAQLPGMYRAWLSIAGESARDRLGDASGWIRPDARPFATDAEQIAGGRFYFPPVLDETGGMQTGFVWTGTLEGNPEPAGGSFCGDWMDNGGGVGLVGDLGAGPGWWSAFSTHPCDMAARLVCFGVDQQHEIDFQPMPGRLAFVSTGYVAPNAGREAADTLCQQEASNAGHDGEFLALLGVDGEAPSARFDAGGEPWVRQDGVPIFPEGDPFAVALQTPIALHADGSTGALAIGWAGSYDAIAPGTNDASCTSWSATTGFAAMFNLIHIYWMGWMLGGGSPECEQPGYPVICLET